MSASDCRDGPSERHQCRHPQADTQSALWLRRPVSPDQRNAFYCGFNAIYARLERTYAALIAGMAARSVVMVAIALAIIIVTGHGFGHVATGFLPVEEQGYLLASVQLPDGASLGRTQKALDEVTRSARKTLGVPRPLRAYRRSTTRRRLQMAVSPISSSSHGASGVEARVCARRSST